MTELTQEQLAEIRGYAEKFMPHNESPGAVNADRLALLAHIDRQAAKLAKARELRGAIEAFMRSPQKKDDKARAWEFGNCIAYIKNGLDAILEGDSA